MLEKQTIRWTPASTAACEDVPGTQDVRGHDRVPAPMVARDGSGMDDRVHAGHRLTDGRPVQQVDHVMVLAPGCRGADIKAADLVPSSGSVLLR